MEHNSSPPATPSGHEPNAIDVRAVWLSGVGLFAILVATFFLMVNLWQGLAGQAATTSDSEPTRSKIASSATGVPELNPKQHLQLERLRINERELLTEYAWIDREAGVARIPIDRAIQIVAESGLPRTGGTPLSSGGRARE